MLIVNQTGDKILNMDNIESIVVSGYGVSGFMIHNNDEFYELGDYKTENEAKKIFRDLISAYANNEKIFFMPEE